MMPTLASLVAGFALQAGPSPALHHDSMFDEHKVDSGTEVFFFDDDLRASERSIFGDTVRRPPGALRYGLLRPRFHFIPELTKSIEQI
jgi:hypothetical protein